MWPSLHLWCFVARRAPVEVWPPRLTPHMCVLADSLHLCTYHIPVLASIHLPAPLQLKPPQRIRPSAGVSVGRYRVPVGTLLAGLPGCSDLGDEQVLVKSRPKEGTNSPENWNLGPFWQQHPPEGRNPAFRFFNSSKCKQDKFVAVKASRTLTAVKIARPNYKSGGAKTFVLLRPDRSGHMTC